MKKSRFEPDFDVARPVRLSVWIFGIAAAIQLGILLSRTILPLAKDIRTVRDLPALQRSAYLAFGDQFAGYVEFVRSRVPETATVIIPSPDVDYALGHVGIMQYFLFPRMVADCPDGVPNSECVAGLGGKSTYILAVGNFPSAASVMVSKDYIPFADGLGLYAPRPVDGGEGP